MDWEVRGAVLPTQEAHIIPACSPDRSRVLVRKLTGETSATRDLKFVNLSHPDDVRQQKEVRTEIRRHVMKDIGQRRRRPRRKEITPQATPTSSSELGSYEDSQLRGAIVKSFSPNRSLAMLGNFPVKADMRVLELMHFSPYQPFRSVWIEVALCDPGAFHVTLGNAADYLNKINGNDSPNKSPEVLSHYKDSTVLLRRRLNSFEEGISEGAIANILAHVCLAMRHCDWDGWSVHMNGLSLIAKLRGGFANVGHRMSLLILLYDLAGAMIFDSRPRFYLPTNLAGTSNRSLRGVPPRLQGLLIQFISPTIAPAGEALRMISSIADVINTNSHSTTFWQRDIDAISLIGPCIHFLLSMPRLPTGFETMANLEDLIAREMVRLACLMLMSKLKELFAISASERVELQARVAEFMSQSVKILGKRYSELKSWALVTVALLQHRDGRGVYMREIHEEMRTMDIPTPSDMLDIARDIVWIDILLSPYADELAEDMALHVALSEASLLS
ncbi:hypothetical protein N7474_006658 [Penicillium riverlandense]|uniref:uncharacterized protein n=1 Tax=Penicillium riverlandense TaxID=1903569 RepID=UPI0025496B6F|nr:uncharacterized protein N7474_006658 [Penicillium riverlandense]KAJ5814881.1 hypothetical protein N7474_006658 [Penicillium riverlandense]